MTNTLSINNREYPSILNQTSIVICLDGSQKEYIDEASKLNLTPNLDDIIQKGENLMAHSAIPSFTNPNNISIVTGQPSSVHGICGNFFYTPETGKEVMMNDPQYLRAPTIFEKFYQAGAKIALVSFFCFVDHADMPRQVSLLPKLGSTTLRHAEVARHAKINKNVHVSKLV